MADKNDDRSVVQKISDVLADMEELVLDHAIPLVFAVVLAVASVTGLLAR